MATADAIAAATGTPVRRCTDMGGSHAWRLYRGELADGRAFFAKAAAGHGEALRAEARGLQWLGEVAAGVPVPEVWAGGDGLLVVRWLEEVAPTAAAAEEFGRRLARTHAAGAPEFGAPWPGWLATLPLDNTGGGAWPQWFARRRLEPYLRRARDAGTLTAEDTAAVQRAVDRIDSLAGPAEPPARIHGDLWAGNLRWQPHGAAAIDPAAHGGHRESDLAMLHLFGAPRLDRILAAYQEAAPLADGWAERRALHQLHPLLAHVCLFGASYRPHLLEAARRCA